MANDDKIKLRLMGLSYSQLQSGAYALILAQVDGPVRIPVVIGAAEAQSIAIKLEGIRPPPPFDSLSVCKFRSSVRNKTQGTVHLQI